MAHPPTDRPDDRVLCVGCGYDLRGIDEDGVCPECGTPVERSRRGDALAAADPAWLRRVGRGLLLAGIGSIVMIARIPLAIGLAIFGGAWIPAWLWAAEEIASTLASLGLVLVGVIGVTALDPRMTFAEQPRGLRRIARWAAIVAVVLMIVHNAVELTGTPPALGGALVPAVLFWSFTATLVAAIVASTIHLARLVDRVPDSKLASNLRFRGRGLGLMIAVAVAGGLLRGAFGAIGGPVLDVLGTIVAMFGGMASIAGFVFAVLLMSAWWRTRAALKLCIAIADEGGPSI